MKLPPSALPGKACIYSARIRSSTQPQAVVSELRQENQPGLIDKAVHLGSIE
ncbi:hypothetical protein IQ274_26965 [Nostoc sp. LEGE 12447]|uniref:hypothetical protein n=1 Tax=Nostoc sp. LEGE 12447 TaxID=1828640 RepID=UPI001883E86B|nr:hypothetical protein [Nostoc sp. LEGE 12447]MBE9001752.1 hypothetical protein [Nostoc sp. LEGE 12447]